MDRKTQFNIWFVIVAFLGVLAFQYVWHAARTVATIPYSEFQQLARDDKVSDVIITENHIQGRLKEPLPDGRSQFITRKVESDLASELAAKGVTVTGATEETFVGQGAVLGTASTCVRWRVDTADAPVRRFGTGGRLHADR
jgi:cell division protease FtsH